MKELPQNIVQSSILQIYLVDCKKSLITHWIKVLKRFVFMIQRLWVQSLLGQSLVQVVLLSVETEHTSF